MRDVSKNIVAVRRLPQKKYMVALPLTKWASVRGSVRLSILALTFGVTIAVQASEATLQGVVIISRHGVRSPTSAPEKLAPYAAEPWNKWEVPPGHLTPRGKELAALMGAYYRDRYTAAGLLTGRAEDDRKRVFFRTNNYQRTKETGRGLSAGLVGDPNPDLHAVADGQGDPLFQPEKVGLGNPDRELAVAAMRARLGPDPDLFVRTAYQAQFEKMHHVLFGDQAVAPGKIPLLSVPLTFEIGEEKSVEVEGSLDLAKTFTENFLLEYAQGFARVGWGRVTRATLIDLLKLSQVDFDLKYRTPYMAELQASNMASHLLATLEQAAKGERVPGAIGDPSHRLVILVGHDTNLANFSGLLDTAWSIDGMPLSPLLPGGALALELWRHDDGKLFVRTYYMAQTLDQLRSGQVLSLQTPPAIAPVFLPGCSTAGPDYEAPFEDFAARFRRVIDPQFVAPR